jgi:hypothetical protein
MGLSRTDGGVLQVAVSGVFLQPRQARSWMAKMVLRGHDGGVLLQLVQGTALVSCLLTPPQAN